MFSKLKTLDKKILAGAFLIFLPVGIFTLYLIVSPYNARVDRRRFYPVSPTRFILHNSITKISPQPDSVNIGIYSPISAVFKKPVSNSEKNQAGISIIPTIKGKILWSSDNKEIKFIPDESFNPSSSYKVILSFSGMTQEWSFKTISSEKVSEKDALINQTKADTETAEALQKFYSDFPWWNKFPIQTNSYFVYFNPERRVFVGLLYPKKSSPSSTEQQVGNMKTQIITTIKGFGVIIENYRIEWKIMPEP